MEVSGRFTVPVQSSSHGTDDSKILKFFSCGACVSHIRKFRVYSTYCWLALEDLVVRGGVVDADPRDCIKFEINGGIRQL